MVNYKTGAQRYNDRMDKIFKKSEEAGHHTLHGSTEAKSEALKKKMIENKGKKALKYFNSSQGVSDFKKHTTWMNKK